ncbi:MAG: hypothetical protein PHT69_14510 [Bacteroidales bacterium]|nr:hypothetical protein [Bacteroidales bacterium]
MNRVIILLLLFFCISFSHAQLFSKDTMHMNLSVGIGWSYSFDNALYKNRWSLPSLSAEVERGFFNIGNVGCIAVGMRGTYKYLQNRNPLGDAYWHNVLVGATGKFYLNYFNNLKIIPYAGFFGGFNAITFTDNSFSSSSFYPTNYNGVFPLIYVFGGAKYQSKNNYGILAEFAYGLAFATLGVYWNL